MKNSKVKKTVNVILNVIVYIFLAICICSVVLTLFSKKDNDGAAEIFGYQMRIVTSDSMAACEFTDVSNFEIKDIPVRSMIFVKVMPEDPAKADEWYKSLKVGDVLTFRYVYTTQVTITHRIASITEKPSGGYIIQLEGDNKTSDSNQMYQTIDTSVPYSTNYVIGKVTGQSYAFGVLMSFLMEPVGMVLIIMLPCVIIMIFEIVKVARILGESKRAREREKHAEENEIKENEIAELRRKLAELEKAKAEGDNKNSSSDNGGDA